MHPNGYGFLRSIGMSGIGHLARGVSGAQTRIGMST